MSDILKNIQRFIINTRQIYIEYKKSMSDLSVITREDTKGNINIVNLVEWFREEYNKRPEKYPGDHFIINSVKHQCLLGSELNTAINEAKKQAMITLKAIDINRKYG